MTQETINIVSVSGQLRVGDVVTWPTPDPRGRHWYVRLWRRLTGRHPPKVSTAVIRAHAPNVYEVE